MSNCITNGAYVEAAQSQAGAIKEAAYVDTAIQVGLALWQRNSSGSIADLQDEIAKRQMKLAEQLHDHAKEFWPYEKAFVDDAFAENKHDPEYLALSAEWSEIIGDTMRRGRTDWLNEMRQRCIRPTACEAARWDRNAQKTRADIISFADRQAEARADILNDMRYSRQYTALGLGKGILGTIKSYQSLAGNAGASAREMLVGTINSGLTALGYYQERQEFSGWGDGIRDTFARAPYQAQGQVAQRVQQRPEVYAVETRDSITETSLAPRGCGPAPAHDAGHKAWQRYNDCMGYK